jgi:hypothetical protein
MNAFSVNDPLIPVIKGAFWQNVSQLFCKTKKRPPDFSDGLFDLLNVYDLFLFKLNPIISGIWFGMIYCSREDFLRDSFRECVTRNAKQHTWLTRMKMFALKA